MQSKLNLIKDILIFSLPIITGQIGQMLFGVGDIIVAGHYSSLAVAAIGVAAGIFAPFLIAGIGFLLCTGPLASQLKGEGKEDPTLLFNAYVVSLIVSIVLIPAIYFCHWWLPLLNLQADLIPHVQDYLQLSAVSLFPALLFQATKEYLQAKGHTYIPTGIILVSNLFNILFNIVFMFGLWGYPGMGIKGAAVATFLCRVLMAVAVIIYMLRICDFKMEFHSHWITRIFKLGTPIAFTLLCEVLIFSVVTILVGGMNLIASAAQSLVINITSLTFMVPLAIGSAISVLIGEQFGKKSLKGIEELTKASLILTLTIQILFAALYLLLPNEILSVATSDSSVILYGAGILFWVGIFQIPDGVQVVLAGVMRGLNETKIPMILGLISYWVLGLPIGAYFAYQKNLEARGLWMGLAIGLTCMCIFLVFFYQTRIKKLSRLMSN